ncbi:hypothetical protein [Streptomyces sp. Wb2n-11]|uniref:hypothetical protein n=1 Tax=Streptomyces sp. Wb2n-11 TaxID=1030533 RepID=UPI000A62544B|nr:hypothetical protein [Streptomyces sp. Wb2n-11]
MAELPLRKRKPGLRGGTGPAGSKVEPLDAGGAAWDPRRGNTGGNAHSFARTSSTSSVNPDTDGFPRALGRRGEASPSTYRSSVRAGAEVFTRKGRPDTSSYAATAG